MLRCPRCLLAKAAPLIRGKEEIRLRHQVQCTGRQDFPQGLEVFLGFAFSQKENLYMLVFKKNTPPSPQILSRCIQK